MQHLTKAFNYLTLNNVILTYGNVKLNNRKEYVAMNKVN